MHAPLSDAIPLPAHVPPHLVVDFDFMADPSMTEDMHVGMAALHQRAPPIFYTPRQGGHWIVIGHEANLDVTRNTEVFSNTEASIPKGDQPTPAMFPITLDPPDHGVYRSVLVQAFSPKAVNGLKASIRDLTNSLIDQVIDEGGCDFVPAISEKLPVIVFMKMMGLPLDRFSEFRHWVVTSFSTSDQDLRQQMTAKILEVTGELIRDRQREPKDDLISRFIQADLGGRKPDFDELQAYCLMVFLAGLDTVTNGMSFAFRHLARDQNLQARLRAEPARIPDAIEELLRRYTFTLPGRTVLRDFELAGAPFKAGDMVLLLLPAADLDPKAFPNPERIDLDRSTSHVAFNTGPHRCVGSHLARIELQALYETWMERVPTFRIDPTKPVTFHTGRVLAIESLPLVW